MCFQSLEIYEPRLVLTLVTLAARAQRPAAIIVGLGTAGLLHTLIGH